MAKPSKDRPSPETVAEAQKIARANQRPGQTKEQTKLIAQGIQKGIDQYKKQQKVKAREQGKRRKKVMDNSMPDSESDAAGPNPSTEAGNSKLPWILLVLSWLGFGLYLVFLR